jgi:dienelactone hydrolase
MSLQSRRSLYWSSFPVLELFVAWTLAMAPFPVSAQEYGKPDRDQPGDESIQHWLTEEARRLDGQFAADLVSREHFEAERPRWRAEYLEMLGLSPLPERTPLRARMTHRIEQDDYAVDCLHYQSQPGLYVTANLYRPKEVPAGTKLPAILYVCGHSNRGRDGNKTAYQSHGIWFARHGYLCLMVDTLQLGEIAAIHHGTYREQRWWWHSRGYTSAGVECWNGVRGIDYLVSRDDVDPQRIGVTGISGGGAATFWVAAADERIAAACAVSGMADLESYVGNRVINGHCDCMFLHNTFQWPWTRIAALIAPRPLLFVNSDHDAIFPMDANERITNRLERTYSLFGAGDKVDTLVSIGGHAYRADIRRGVYQFLNLHLKQDGRPVTDSEVDLVSGAGNQSTFPIPTERLRAFPTDADIPSDQLNTRVDESFVPLGQPELPRTGGYPVWQEMQLTELRRVSFRSVPATMIEGRKLRDPTDLLVGINRYETDPGIAVETLWHLPRTGVDKQIRLVVVLDDAEWPMKFEMQDGVTEPTVWLRPRGSGVSQWTRKNPPNYVERSHVLVGQTVDTGRVRDVLAMAHHLRTRFPDAALTVTGAGSAGLIAAYAAVLDDSISAVELNSPPVTHQSNSAPQFLNILRVADVPVTLGLIAPRRLTITTDQPDAFRATQAIYATAGAASAVTIKTGAAVSRR